jgi:hypothetical protein
MLELHLMIMFSLLLRLIVLVFCNFNKYDRSFISSGQRSYFIEIRNLKTEI